MQHYTDLQGLVRRVLRFFRRKLDQARQALRYFGRERKARRFPESDHRLAQMVLFIWGNLPRFGSRFRERLYHLRRRSIRSGSKRRALFEKVRLHPALFLGSAVAVAAIAVVLSLYTITGENRENRGRMGKRVLLRRQTATICAGELNDAAAYYGMDEDLLRRSFSLIVGSWSN